MGWIDNIREAGAATTTWFGLDIDGDKHPDVSFGVSGWRGIGLVLLLGAVLDRAGVPVILWLLGA